MSQFNVLSRPLGRIALASVLSIVLGSTAAFAQARTFHFDIPERTLSQALREFGRVSGQEIIFTEDLVVGVHAAPLRGDFTADSALERLLKGTGLSAERSASGALMIRRQTKARAATESNPLPTARVAPADPQPTLLAQNETPSGPSPSDQQKQAREKKPLQLEEVVVTGSRIPSMARDGAQDVRIYDRNTIDQSGQSTLGDFLNTLPEVGRQTTQAEYGNTAVGHGAATVQLRGLPAGTTLVLVNGRRLETSGSAALADVFDLSNIPLGAVDRIEVLPTGSSAVYGSDAIGGIVNIIMKKDFRGTSVTAGYGAAAGTNSANLSIAWGGQWDNLSISLLGSFEKQSELEGFDRSLTANNDYRKFGGIDAQTFGCNPGNVYTLDGGNLPGTTAPYAAVPHGFSGRPSQQEFAATAGTLNECSSLGYGSLIPPSQREGVYGQVEYQLVPKLALFTEFLGSHSKQENGLSPFDLFGEPGFQQFTVPATNPYNPFGQDVGISYHFADVARDRQDLSTNFYRVVAGARGTWASDWSYELAGWAAHDSTNLTSGPQLNSAAAQAALDSADPATALNPFVDGPAGSGALQNSLFFASKAQFAGSTAGFDATLRGTAFDLPSGPIKVGIGGEHHRDSFYSSASPTPVQPSSLQDSHREQTAGFGEARIPLWAGHSTRDAGDLLDVTLAGRYDNYSDFGGKFTSQEGLEVRPVDPILLRATYGEAFKAPPLYNLYYPTISFPSFVTDPLLNNRLEPVTLHFGGNAQLKPETGTAKTLGIVYTSKAVPTLRIAATLFSVRETNYIQLVSPQVVVNNPALFAGSFTRAPSVGGQPGPITSVNYTYQNFGEIDVKGVDSEFDYSIASHWGTWSPSIRATYTYDYSAALLPGRPKVNFVSVENDNATWAPRWKGTLSLRWLLERWSAAIDGRYIGRYRDADPLPAGNYLSLGNFWYWDANVRYALRDESEARHTLLAHAYLSVGAVNVFDSKPQFSNQFQGFTGGYDAQADIRGRFLYVQLSTRF